MTRHCILLRHGRRRHNTGVKPDDGPLTDEGRKTSLESARKLSRELSEQGITQIDLAIVSASVRCVETFGIFWEVFSEAGIVITENDIHPNYFFTSEEHMSWVEFDAKQGEIFRETKEHHGEKEAVRMHALHLFSPCLERTMTRLYKALDAGAQTVLVCTHGPLDAFMAEELTSMPHEGLLQGEAKIVSFQY